ncbi:hypothetical protein [Cellulomonas carbonis]|uniref:Uncharacterized protein n=1 Tax=Cellulomonas carbonis T26 TaxID=947969 RepID=A0A0A0BPY3_9CELL|nr:hypothetical protein [Cellulomonas carbonis]KGM09697.1 hypothetical protein N868_18510 [Cellulomonas carbonis T26]GGC05292.1 hypothetical protein GCM10010972_18050 [Cellulomonas carbonis]
MALSRRKSAAVALAVVGVAGLSLASAAQLNVTTGSLGAASEVVASCQPDGGTAIAVTFGSAYDAATKAYRTGSVVLSDVLAACANQGVDITVFDVNGTALATATGTAAEGTKSFTLVPVDPAATTVDPAAVEGVAVVIAG